MLPAIRPHSQAFHLVAVALVAGVIVAAAPRAHAADTTRPDATTTGVPAGTTLTSYTGPLVITADGTTLDGYDITGCLEIQADNVTIRNSRIRCGDGVDRSSRAQMVRTRGGYGPTLLDHVELDGLNTAWTMAVMGPNTTVRHADIHGVGDAIKAASNSTYEYNYIHDLTPDDVQHNDGIQMSQGQNVVIRYNRIDRPPTQTSDILLKADLGPIDNVLIESNWLTGGNYTLYLIGEGPSPRENGSDTPYPTSNITVRNNHFGTGYKWGALLERAVDTLTWECNWLDDGTTTTVLPYDHPDNQVDGPSPTDTIIDTGCTPPTDDPQPEPSPEPNPEPSPEPSPEPAEPDLVFSVNSDRSAPQPLDSATVSGDVYVFVANDTDVTQTDFAVDGSTYRTEITPPFDLEGEIKDADGNWQLVATDTTTWTEGTHTVRATTTMSDGSTRDLLATLTVDNVADAPEPEPSPEPEPTPSTLHVADLDALVTHDGPQWLPSVVVSVVDSAGQVVPAAAVSGTWTNGGSSVVCVTDLAGSCRVDGPWLHKRDKSATFSVTGIVHPLLAYDASANTDPDGSSDGTRIVVTR